MGLVWSEDGVNFEAAGRRAAPVLFPQPLADGECCDKSSKGRGLCGKECVLNRERGMAESRARWRPAPTMPNAATPRTP